MATVKKNKILEAIFYSRDSAAEKKSSVVYEQSNSTTQNVSTEALQSGRESLQCERLHGKTL